MPAPTDSVAITALPAVVTAAGTDIFPVVQGGVTSRETNAQLATYLQTLTWPVAGGGTGLTSYAIGDLIYASGATTLAKLADVATGNALISGGVGVAPSWGKISLTAAVSGILPLANGGSGADLSATGGANQIVRQDSAGGVFTVSILAAGDIPNLDASKITTGTLASARGGTGVNNAGTITNASNTTITGGGTLALGGFTATIPATLTVAGLAIANAFTAAQSIITTATTALVAKSNVTVLDIQRQSDNLALLTTVASTGITTIFQLAIGVGATIQFTNATVQLARVSNGLELSSFAPMLFKNTQFTTEMMRLDSAAASPKIGVLGAAASARQTGGENLTNNVTSGGTDGTIANFTDLTIYANDAAAIRNDIYQLARMLKQDHDALRLFGFLT